MRIKIEFSETESKLPINNQHLVNSYIHKVLGNNNIYHDAKSNYCISQLCGGKMNEDKSLSFKKNPFIIVTSDDMEFINKIIIGVMNTPEFCSGIIFKNISFIDEYFYNGWNHFFTLSPILLKEQTRGERVKFITVNDADYSEKLKNHMINKLSKIDSKLDLSDFEIIIGDKLKKVRKVLVKNVINHASSVKISIKTNKTVASKLYNLGLGQSTGSGFGTIYKTENYDLFKF